MMFSQKKAGVVIERTPASGMVEEIAFIVTDSGRLSDTLSRAPAGPEQLKKTERTFRRPSFSLLFDRNGFSTAPPLLLPDS